ncbi:MAG TPA: pyridoxamine 5'-phosphate oxidase family protein [Pseudonocardiaceae bacterium]|nr:pyridoxamine 5'-phosphate oxidase family protein [Pseudonocardiaceae bacterium]
MHDSGGSEVLHSQECLRLLATVPIGRVVFTDQALPGVLPVAFLLHDGMIVLRTRDGSKLSAKARDTVVAFEADEFDIETRTGWSVTVIGHARHIRNGSGLAELRALEESPRASGRGEHLIGISAEIVNGFRIMATNAAT